MRVLVLARWTGTGSWYTNTYNSSRCPPPPVAPLSRVGRQPPLQPGMPWRQQRTRPKRGSYCRRVCRQTCASDGVCRDGGHGAHSGNRPQCAYGEDCADCGKRALCTPAGTGMELPIDALRRGTRTPLLLSQLLFVVMGSHRLRAHSAAGALGARAGLLVHAAARAVPLRPRRAGTAAARRARRGYRGGSARDGHPGDSATDGGAEAGRRLRAVTFDAARDRYAQPGSPTSGEMPVVRIRGAAPPRRCVCNESDVTAGDRGESFFCRQHRAATLEAQYCFLPALQHVRSSPRFERGDLRWVVLVDDDSFVFAERLRAPADAARAETPARRRHSLRRRATITRRHRRGIHKDGRCHRGPRGLRLHRSGHLSSPPYPACSPPPAGAPSSRSSTRRRPSTRATLSRRRRPSAAPVCRTLPAAEVAPSSPLPLSAAWTSPHASRDTTRAACRPNPSSQHLCICQRHVRDTPNAVLRSRTG